MSPQAILRHARGLRARVAVLLVGGVMLAWVAFFLLLLISTRAWLFDELQHRGRVLATSVAKELVTPVVVADRARITSEVTQAALQEDVRGIAVYASGTTHPITAMSAESGLWESLPAWAEPTGATGRIERWTTLGGTPTWEVIEPMRRVELNPTTPEGEARELFGFATPGTRTVGYVRVVLSTDRMMRAINNARLAGALILLAAFLCGTLLSMRLVRIVVQPLRDAATLARDIAGGRLDHRIPVTHHDELGDLAESMNTMAAALQASRARAQAEADALRATAHAVVAIARGARASHDPASVFALVAGQLRQIAAVDGVALAVESEADGALRIEETDPLDGWGSLRTGDPLDPVLARLARDAGDMPRRLQCTYAGGKLSRSFYTRGIAEVLVVPLSVHSGRVAVLLLGSREEGTISAAQEEVVVGLAAHLSSALLASDLGRRVERAFDEVRRTREHLERSERLRMAGEMAAGVAHDFNNLLGAILGRAQLLRLRAEKGDAPSEDVLKAVTVIEKACHDGAETVRRMRRVSESDESPSERVSVDRVLHDVMEFTRPRWEVETQGTGRSITVTLDSEPNLHVAGRSGELREVFTNLLLNAADALPHGGVITLQSHATVDDHVLVTVRDTGTGMNEDTLARAFDPFFTTKGDRGTGLGLSMVYGIVQRHGGTITVSSTPGKGTGVDVRLPLAAAEEEEADARAEPEPAPAQRRERTLRVAIVDDEPALRELLGEMVTELGHTADVFTTGEDVLAALTEGSHDLLLTDLGMPGMSGWHVASAVRAIDQRVVIAFVTGWGDSVDPQKVRAAGADVVVAKPFTLAQVTELVQLALSGRPGRSQAA